MAVVTEAHHSPRHVSRLCLLIVITISTYCTILTYAQEEVNENCPTPMCSTPCPEGQYLALDANGCETCNCYNPCQDVVCTSGKCTWILNERGRPKTFCADCPGGKEWNACGPGSCIPTCTNTSPACPRNCYRGCYCPPNKPVWNRDRCITVEQCKDECDGGQVWTDSGTDLTPTCDDPNPGPAQVAQIGRCTCPADRPMWDERTSQCVTQEQCQ